VNVLPTGNLRTNSGAVLIVAALAGHGLVYLPTYFVGDALQSGRLVTVLDDYMAPPLTLRALYPHNRYLSAKVRAFVDFLAARFEREPPWDNWRRASREPSGG
jgi:DNA-binding transcriptional LysR family regulator